jgi:hypothetical protein
MNAPRQVIVIPVPIAGSPPWDKSRGRPPDWQRKPSSDRPPAYGRQPIPAPVPVDREMVKRMIEAGRKHLEEIKPMRAVLLGWAA